MSPLQHKLEMEINRRRNLVSYLVRVVHLFELESTVFSLAHIRVVLQTLTERRKRVRLIATRSTSEHQKRETKGISHGRT